MLYFLEVYSFSRCGDVEIMKRLKAQKAALTWKVDENVLMSAAAEHNNTEMTEEEIPDVTLMTREATFSQASPPRRAQI